MNPFPAWRGITRHICNEAAEAFAAFVDSLPPLDDATVSVIALVVLFLALTFGVDQ